MDRVSLRVPLLTGCVDLLDESNLTGKLDTETSDVHMFDAYRECEIGPISSYFYGIPLFWNIVSTEAWFLAIYLPITESPLPLWRPAVLMSLNLSTNIFADCSC